jgi:uncharacterized protein YjbI with pentapeptide repeats
MPIVMHELDESSPTNEAIPVIGGNELPDWEIYGYQVQEKLSEHQHGERISYLAKDLNFIGSEASIPEQQLVVIKEWRERVNDPHAADDYAHYLPEIQRLQQLNHLNIPRYLDSFATPTGFCVVRTYQPGISLAELHSLPPSDIKLVADAMLKILNDLHQLTPAIVHLNIKPENIIVKTEPKLQIYLVDFGLHSASYPHRNMGTPGFIPPEQLADRHLTASTDIYGLGISLICLITGTLTSKAQQLFDRNYCLQFRHLLPTNTDPQLLMQLESMVAPDRSQHFQLPSTSIPHQGLSPRSTRSRSKQKNRHSHSNISPADSEVNLPTPKRKIRWRRWAIGVGILLSLGLVARQFLPVGEEELSPAQIAKNQEIAKQAEFAASDRGKILKEKRCPGCNLNYQNFAKAELSGVIAPQSSLIGSNFTNANLKLAIFRDADFSGANLSKANLQQAAFYGAKLIGTNLAGANLTQAKLVYAKLKGAWLRDANLSHADLKFAELQQIDLRNANLTGADLSNADLSNSNLRYAILVGAKLDRTNLTGATMPDGSIHP